MSDDKKDKDPLEVLRRLADPNAKPDPKYADLARAPGAEAWQPGKKVYLSKFPPVPMSAELQRVLELPKRSPLELHGPRAEALVEMMTARWGRGERQCACAEIDKRIAAGKKTCIKRLKPVQAWMLYELGIVGGLIAHAPVGVGKTLVDILGLLALEPLNITHALLLVPSNLLEQLEHDYYLIREHFKVPSMTIHDGKGKTILSYDGAPRLHAMPFSRLSRPDASAWIRELQPQAVLVDELDRLRDPDGAGASRVLRHYKERGETVFAGWTGSITDASVTDYCHLAALALRLQSPVPIARKDATDWARALDDSDNPAPPGELGRLCDDHTDLDPSSTDDVREAYRRRLTSTLGVVISTEASVNVDLVIEKREAPPIPDIVQRALDMVRVDWVRPDTLVGAEHDEELVDAMQVAKCARELASGIFYRWRFDPINGVPQKREDVEEWYDARKEWNSELRGFLFKREEWLDSPLLCEHAAQRHHGDRPQRPDRPNWPSLTWPRWRAIKGRVKPTTEACRVSDYLAVDAARWATEHLGIVWYGLVEFGQWVAEISGLPLHGGGPDAGRRIMAEVGNRSIIASIKSHGRGRDGLQSLFYEQLVSQIPSGSAANEQLLGRLHRQGQQAEEVRTWIYLHTPEYRNALDTALGRSAYVKGTLGAEMKLLIGYRE